MRSTFAAAFALWMVALLAGRGVHAGQSAGAPFPGVLDEHPAIQYAERPAHDRVARLSESLAAGQTSLSFQKDSGYLRSVLDALRVPVESQLLVFSKTGIQSAVTGPDNPRALFYNQSVVVGYIPGARVLEIASQDPEQGVVFYTVEQDATTSGITRETNCLSCHVSASTLEVPGLIARSNYLAADGNLMPQLGSFTVNHRTPLIQRWGGWFVTGDYTPQPYGTVVHIGNVTVAGQTPWGPETTSNEAFIRWLNSKPETRGYPSTESDISALLVFDHQAHAVNLLTRLNWEARVAAGGGRPDYSTGILRKLVDETADYFLFVDEAPPPARIIPRPGFAETFAAPGPKDRAGRSLRELNLETRLMRYPCSYMVYSEAFQRLAVRRARGGVSAHVVGPVRPGRELEVFAPVEGRSRRRSRDSSRHGRRPARGLHSPYPLIVQPQTTRRFPISPSSRHAASSSRLEASAACRADPPTDRRSRRRAPAR